MKKPILVATCLMLTPFLAQAGEVSRSDTSTTLERPNVDNTNVPKGNRDTTDQTLAPGVDQSNTTSDTSTSMERSNSNAERSNSTADSTNFRKGDRDTTDQTLAPGDQSPGDQSNTQSDSSPTMDRSNPNADNTTVNKRDRNARSLTPMDQSNNKTDINITQAIRKSIMKQDLSSDAKNIKIITQNGEVTLRGPVNDSAEAEKIATLAKSVPGIKTVNNQLEVK